MNSPKTLKIAVGLLTAALLTTAALLVHARWQNSMWVKQIDGLARFAGSTAAKNDFQSGKVMLFTFAGERDADAFSGTNDGPFAIWYSQYFPQDFRYYPFRYTKEQMVKSYNDTMKSLHASRSR